MLVHNGMLLIFSIGCLTLSMVSGEGLKIQTGLSSLPSLGLMYKHLCSFICKIMRKIWNMATNHVTLTYLLFFLNVKSWWPHWKWLITPENVSLTCISVED